MGYFPTAAAYILPSTTNNWYVYHNWANPAGYQVPNVGQSRPIILNRPFRSVADMSYAFRGEPYKNVDFMTAQSGDASLLDAFCVQDDSRTDALVSGKVNLNTRQLPVLEAILSGAYRDETQAYNSSTQAPTISATEATNIATALVSRTAAAYPKGPLMNISQIVGKFIPGSAGVSADPYASTYLMTNDATGSSVTITGGYDGFINDLAKNSIYSNGSANGNANNTVQRYLETAARALADAGTTRTWNLMIDLVAQTGRYPSTATSTDQFVVQGEQHLWVHVAIDRYTGKIIDENIETVKE
jgi:hypothetical protein